MVLVTSPVVGITLVPIRLKPPAILTAPPFKKTVKSEELTSAWRVLRYELATMLLCLVGASSLAHAVYNTPCESVVVGDLKRVVEDLNSNITVKLGDGTPAGNPQMLDASRFQNEFQFESVSICDRLRRAAGK